MSSHDIAIVVVSAILAAAWMPVGVHFWRSWKRRGSPLSLAICALVAFPIFTNASSAVFLTGSGEQTVMVMAGTNFLLLLNFMICFRWQKERFPEARDKPIQTFDPPDFWSRKAPETREEDAEEEVPPPPRS